MVLDLDLPCTQQDFASLVGISQQRVSELVADGTLPLGGTATGWLLAYCERLREQAAGRLGSEAGGLDLAQERAALAKAQREGIELKNSVLRGQYADVSLLAQVLATASQAVAQRFDHLPGQVRKACPHLPPQVTDIVMATIAAARNEWVRQTIELATVSIATTDDDDAS